MKETKENSEDLWDGRVISLWSSKEHKKYAKEFRNDLIALADKELIGRFNNHCTSVGGVTITIYRQELIKEMNRRFDINAIQKRNKDGGLKSTLLGPTIKLVDKTIKII